MRKFIEWLLSGDEMLTDEIMKRYDPKDLLDLWQKIDNLNMIAGIIDNYTFKNDEPDILLELDEHCDPEILDKIPTYKCRKDIHGDECMFWCHLNDEDRSRVHENTDEFKSEIGFEIMEYLYDLYLGESKNG